MKFLWTTLLLISSSFGAQQISLSTSERLLEYSCDYFDDGGYTPPSSLPLLKPPQLTLYRDGTVIFERDGRFYQGTLSEKGLARIEGRLARSVLLQHSQILRHIRGEELLMHGGICHFAYLSGQERVVVAAFVVPTGGEWERVVRAVRKRLPPPTEPYRPSTIRISVATAAPNDWPAWPHVESIDLAAAMQKSSVEISDSGVIDFLFTHRPALGIWHFTLEDTNYRITLLEVPGWYEPYGLEQAFWDLADR